MHPLAGSTTLAKLEGQTVVHQRLRPISSIRSKLLKVFTRVVFLEAIFALAILGFCTSSSVASPDDSTTAQSAAVRDGSHDFDFIYGK